MVTAPFRSSFPATHRIRIDARGTLEPAHAHNWRVCVWLQSSDDADAPQAVACLERWVGRYEGASFNDVEPFDTVNPTAEEVARVLCEEVEKALPHVRVLRVEVGEAAGFSATYWPGDAL